MASFIEQLQRYRKGQTFCETCKLIFHDTNHPRTQDHVVRTDRSQRVPFDCLHRLRSRSGCRICALIVQRIGTPSSQCRCVSSSDSCIYLQVAPSEHEHEWRLFHQEIFKGTIIQTSKKNWKEKQHMIWDDTIASPNVINNWITRCKSFHPDCRPAEYLRHDNRGRLLGGISKMLFIDVEQDKIVESNIREKYAALSYVWGGACQTVALRANIEDLKRRGALRSNRFPIPQLISDSIALSFSLGIRYLWVDCLCIIQDDSTKHNTLARMDSIYSMAYITIVAIDSDSARCQLPGILPQSRQHLHPGVKTKSDWFHTKPSCAMDSYISSTKYNSRAWTFQEVLLSTRCVYMTKTQMLFRCRTGVWAETAPSRNLGLSADLYARKWKDLSGENRLRAFRELVQNYSGRQLSYSTDVLDAFSGITSLLSSNTDWQFVDGVLVQQLPYDVLFIPEGDIARRVGVAGQPWLPSWSWAGWKGKVRWSLGASGGLDGDLDCLWKVVSEGRTFEIGSPTMTEVGLLLMDDALASLQTDESRKSRKSLHSRTFGTTNISLESVYSSQMYASEIPLTNLLRFRARTAPASDFQVDVYSGDDLSEQVGPVSIITYKNCQVGILIGKEEKDFRLEFIQVTSQSALLIGAGGTRCYDERRGVAFFWDSNFFEKYPIEHHVLG